MIQVEKDVEVGGTVFEYDDGKPETLTAKGPLKEVGFLLIRRFELAIAKNRAIPSSAILRRI